MELSITNREVHQMKLRFEDTKHRLGIRIWGNRWSFHELHEMLEECWECEEPGCMSRKEECSYIGVISYFSYTVRHAFMGDRLVKLDGKPLKAWSDEMFQTFENEQERFEVGMEISWPQMLFIMAAWWECLRLKDCPMRVLPVMHEFTENIERLMLQRSKVQYTSIEPYIHGAIYVANPYLMHTMEHINVRYLQRARYGRVPLSELAEMMEYAIYGSWQYKDYMVTLKRQAKKLNCQIEEVQEQVDESVYDIEF